VGLEEVKRLEGDEEDGGKSEEGRVLKEKIHSDGGGGSEDGHDASFLINSLDERGAATGLDGLPKLELSGEIAGGGEAAEVGCGLFEADVGRQDRLGAGLAERSIRQGGVQEEEGQVGVGVRVWVRVVQLLVLAAGGRCCRPSQFRSRACSPALPLAGPPCTPSWVTSLSPNTELTIALKSEVDELAAFPPEEWVPLTTSAAMTDGQ